MSWLTRIPFVALALLAVTAGPVSAQSYYTDDVAFFERVLVGDVEVTPIGVLKDRRCADSRFCFREDTLIVAVILHDYRGVRELTLELDRPEVVPGGFLVLRDAGTRPSQRSAIRLSEYALDLEYYPIRFGDAR